MKYISICSIVSAIAATVLLNSTANAVTFNGYDENLANNTRLTNPLNSQTEFGKFSANLNNIAVTTESFETVSTTAPGTYIDGLVRSISGTKATFSYTTKPTPTNPVSVSVAGGAAGQVQRKTTGVLANGTYPTDGNNLISINSENNFSISFTDLTTGNPTLLAAFGYFGTDLGDNSNTLTMKFFNGTTEVKSSLIPVNANSFNSSEFFFGFIADNPAQYFDKVSFVSSINSNGDAIGIDQIKIGTPAQVINTVPEPSSLLGTLLFGGSMMLIKRKSKRTVAALTPMVDDREVTIER
jgi:hypothetical protein